MIWYINVLSVFTPSLIHLSVFPFPGPPPPTSVFFLILHFDGKCVSINSKGRLYLTATCTTMFHLTIGKSLKHVESGKCVVPEGYNNGARISLQTKCSDANARYKQTRMYSIQHIPSGKCWHPHERPQEGTEVVLWSGCDQTRLKFRFETGR